MSRGPAAVSFATEDANDPDVWYRFFEDDGSHVGVTVFRAKDRRIEALDTLVVLISSFMGLAETQIRDRLVSVMP
jgi:hypothetical protein